MLIVLAGFHEVICNDATLDVSRSRFSCIQAIPQALIM